MEHFSLECQEQSDGKNCLLVFNEGLQKMLQDSVNSCDFDSKANLMAKVVKIIRRDISERELFNFSYAIVKNGTNVQGQGPTESQECLSLYIAILSVEAKVQGKLITLKFEKPLFPGLSSHSLTRSKKIVNNPGLSIRYNRVLELENLLATAVCKQFGDEVVVCPAKFRKGLFVVRALDNLAYNPSCTTTQDSFHGTAISVFQFPTINNRGTCRDRIVINPSLDRTNIVMS